MKTKVATMLLLTATTAVVVISRLVLANAPPQPAQTVPSAHNLWLQVHELQQRGKILPGSHLYMYGARVADFYTIDRANAPALAAARNGVSQVKAFPAGSLLIKENFNDKKQLGSITAMLKVPGFDPGNRNWVMAMYKPDGTPMAFGKVASCDNCHAIATGSDLVFPPLQHLAPALVQSFFPGQQISPKYLTFFKDQKTP